MGGYGFNPNNGELRPNRLSRLEEIKLEMQEIVSKIFFRITNKDNDYSSRMALRFDQFDNLIYTYSMILELPSSKFTHESQLDAINVTNIDYIEISFSDAEYSIIIYLYKPIGCTSHYILYYSDGRIYKKEPEHSLQPVVLIVIQDRQLAVSLKFLLEEYIRLVKNKNYERR